MHGPPEAAALARIVLSAGAGTPAGAEGGES
jgi:hypothetical protein